MNTQILCFCEIIKTVLDLSESNIMVSDQDWNYLICLAKEHNLFSVFMEEAVKYPTFVSRPEYEMEMKAAMVSVANQMRRTQAFLQLYDSFVKEGLHPIVMKGLICRQLYGKLCDHRPSGDEDILIRSSEYQRAKAILIKNGYITEYQGETEAQLEKLQEISFYNSNTKLHIELHINSLGREDGVRSKMSDCFKDVFDTNREVEINGVKVYTMSHYNHLLYLIFHAFKHFITGGFGVRQMLDILLYQEHYGQEIDMSVLSNTLKEFGLETFWSDMICVGNCYFGFNLSVSQKPSCPNELFEDMIQCGTFGNRNQAEVTASKITKIAVGSKSGSLFFTIIKSIFPSRAFLLNQFPYLEEKPWLLPVEWVKRWGRFIKRSRKNDNNLALESMKINRRRMKLLKKYGLV